VDGESIFCPLSIKVTHWTKDKVDQGSSVPIIGDLVTDRGETAAGVAFLNHRYTPDCEPYPEGGSVKPKRGRGRPKKLSKVIREKWPRVYRTKSHDQERYMVDSRRAGFPQSGRAFYETEAEALAVAEQLALVRHEEGARGFSIISPEQRGDAAEALAILAEHDGADLVSAARFYAAHLVAERKRAVGPTVKEALTAYLESKRAETERGELSRLTLWELNSKGSKIRDFFGEKRIVELDEPMIRDFQAKLDLRPRGKRNVMAKLSQFLNFCVRQKWIASNPASEVPKVKVAQGDVETLSVQEARELLRSAEASEHARNVVPYLAVSLFGGLRPFEAQQLRFEQIDFTGKQIEVLKETSKTRETRFVHIEPALVQWLKPFREKRGLIVGESSNFGEALREVKRQAGFGSGANGTRRWPKDVLRHSYGTYWLKVHNDRPHLAELMGNSLAIIKRHYRRAVPKHAAQSFWQIRPKGTKPVKPVSETIIEFPTQTAETAQQVSGNNG
jgi:integrase/nucleotide-binding universal stress UspA family protein